MLVDPGANLDYPKGDDAGRNLDRLRESARTDVTPKGRYADLQRDRAVWVLRISYKMRNADQSAIGKGIERWDDFVFH